MDEQEGTENYVGFAGCCHALLDRESASKVDFLSVQCVASMMTHVGFASGREQAISGGQLKRWMNQKKIISFNKVEGQEKSL